MINVDTLSKISRSYSVAYFFNINNNLHYLVTNGMSQNGMQLNGIVTSVTKGLCIHCTCVTFGVYIQFPPL